MKFSGRMTTSHGDARMREAEELTTFEYQAIVITATVVLVAVPIAVIVLIAYAVIR